MPADERHRRKRERVLIVMITAVAGLLALALNRRIFSATDFSVSNQVLMFILININLLLLLLLIFLVFRNPEAQDGQMLLQMLNIEFKQSRENL